MASTSETGHIVNLANFKKIIERCEEFGTVYDPPNTDITLANMTSKWTEADGLHSECLVALEATKIPINDRELLFQEILRLAVRSVNLYACTKATKLAVRDARGYLNRLTGHRVKIARLEDGTPDPNYVSNSQRSYVKKTEHLERLIELYKTDSNYAPNEAVLQISNLEQKLEEAKAINDDVHGLIARAIKKRTDRDHALYDVGTGIVDLSLACKKYVRSLFGANSPEAASVTSLSLRRFMRLYAV